MGYSSNLLNFKTHIWLAGKIVAAHVPVPK